MWKHGMLWEGFIKCCERTRPQNYRVLLQLPPPQLASLLSQAGELRKPLLEHVQGFTEAQRQHVPAAIMVVLYNVSPQQETGGGEAQTGEERDVEGQGEEGEGEQGTEASEGGQ